MNARVIDSPNKLVTKLTQLTRVLLMVSCTSVLTACMSTAPTMGGSSGHTVTGGAGGANASGNNAGLESCDQTLGTLALFEDTNHSWWYDYRQRYPKLGSTIPVIRLMVQQSNCFVVVERGRAMAAMNRERELMQSGQLRQGSNVGGGQMVAADYTLSPEIQFSAANTSGIKAIGGALLGSIGSLVGGGVSKNEAATTLLLVDNRSGVQVSAAVGNAGNWDFDIFGGLFAGGLAGGASGYSNTPEGKVLTAAFADSYNQMVKALRNYKAQQVEGGLGKGGKLTVGGADDGTPQASTGAKIVKAPQTQLVRHTQSVTTVERSNVHLRIDEYDEDALNDYYDALKNAATWASALATYSAASIDQQTRDTLVAAMGMFSSQLESHKIELESWPMDAKKQAWAAVGNRIEKYNKLFDKHRSLALKNDKIDQDIVTLLSSLELITYDSLING